MVSNFEWNTFHIPYLIQFSFYCMLVLFVSDYFNIIIVHNFASVQEILPHYGLKHLNHSIIAVHQSLFFDNAEIVNIGNFEHWASLKICKCSSWISRKPPQLHQYLAMISLFFVLLKSHKISPSLYLHRLWCNDYSLSSLLACFSACSRRWAGVKLTVMSLASNCTPSLGMSAKGAFPTSLVISNECVLLFYSVKFWAYWVFC